jgi:hypothetical protein
VSAAKTFSTIYVLMDDVVREGTRFWAGSLECSKVIAAHYLRFEYRFGKYDTCSNGPIEYFYYDRTVESKPANLITSNQKQIAASSSIPPVSKKRRVMDAAISEVNDQLETLSLVSQAKTRLPSSDPKGSLVIILIDLAAWSFVSQSDCKVSSSIIPPYR